VRTLLLVYVVSCVVQELIVRAALQAISAGQPVKTPVTRAYGCTVKYKT